MTLLRYPGGKSKLKTKIVDRMVRIVSFDKLTHYSEPFLGGGSILLEFLSRYADKIDTISINDKDVALAYLWTTVIQSPQYLVDRINSYTPVADDFFSFRNELLKISEESPDHDWRDIGFKKLAIHQMSYSGIGTKAGGPIGGKDQSGEYKVDCRWNPVHLENKIKRMVNLFDKVTITENRCTSYDFRTIILNSPTGSLIYLDPPYFVPGNVLYQEEFSLEDHKRLCNILKFSCSSWVLSYDDCDEINNLYHWANIIPIETKYTINNVEKVKTELLILNDWYLPEPTKKNDITIRPHEFFLCHRTSFVYDTKNKPSGTYNDGMLNSKRDERKTERIGLLGEMAFGKRFNFKVNLAHRSKGEKIDFVSNRYGIDVKSSGTNKGTWYITAYWDRERTILADVPSDIYVFIEVYDNIKLNIADTKIVGWLWKDQILKIAPKKSPKRWAKHWNYEIPRSIMNNIEDLEKHLS